MHLGPRAVGHAYVGDHYLVAVERGVRERREGRAPIFSLVGLPPQLSKIACQGGSDGRLVINDQSAARLWSGDQRSCPRKLRSHVSGEAERRETGRGQPQVRSLASSYNTTLDLPAG